VPKHAAPPKHKRLEELPWLSRFFFNSQRFYECAAILDHHLMGK